MIYDKGDTTEKFYLVLEGVVVMHYGGVDGIPSGIFTTGSFFGEIELLTNTDRIFTCITLSKCSLLVLPKKKFQEIFFQKYPRFGKAFQEIMELRYSGLRRIFEFVQNLIINEVMSSRYPSTKSISHINLFNSKYSKLLF